MANPRFAHLLDLYAKFDRITLVLAGLALGLVLLGWAYHRRPAAFLVFCILLWLLVLAGSAYILITGGSA